MKLNRRMVLWGCVVLAVLSAGLVLPLLASAGFTAAPVPGPRQAPDAPASSVTYTVNVISDTILTAGCTNVSGLCSLRGAVQLANSAGGTPLILFASNVNGMTITLGSTLLLSGGHIVLSDPAFTKTLISAPNNAPAFTLASDSNELDYMEIAGGGAGGGGSQDGVFISSGAHNLLFGDALYHLGG
jgi:hypothetical protein